MHQEVVLGRSGQAFYIEPIERPQRPASVVVTSHTGDPQFATTDCEIDPFESTLAEPAPAGATELRLESTDGIAPGVRYNIARHGVVVTGVDGDRVTLRRALPLALPASTPFLGCRITAPIVNAWAAWQGNLTDHLDIDAGYSLTWTYYVQSEVRTARSTADLVHTPQLARVTPDDVEVRFPGWRAMVARPDDVISEAFDIVRRDGTLHRSIRRARHAFALRELVIIAAHVIAMEHAVLFGGAPHAALAAAESRYQSRLADLVRQAMTPAPPVTSAPAAEAVVDVSHGIVIDLMMHWVQAHPLFSREAVDQLERKWVPRLTTHAHRMAAVRFLRTLQVTPFVRLRLDALCATLQADD